MDRREGASQCEGRLQFRALIWVATQQIRAENFRPGHAHSYSDLNVGVNREIRIRRLRVDTVPLMAKEIEPVSEFLRHLIAQWEAEGKMIKDLAAEAGVAQSLPSQLKARTTNASFYSATKLAKPFGFPDLAALVSAALAWDGTTGVSALHLATSSRTEAVRIAERYGATTEQISRALQRYPEADFARKDTLWWLARIQDERALDAEREAVTPAATTYRSRRKSG
ncbi:MAG: hypothetical protein FWD69_10220 [Polyangiaceae bacterium]|nr:hypothetical protein [Polyangiaceae bacterium]